MSRLFCYHEHLQALRAALAEFAARRKKQQQESIALADASFKKARQKDIDFGKAKYNKGAPGGWKDLPEGQVLIKKME